jgi:hypothetical protein
MLTRSPFCRQANKNEGAGGGFVAVFTVPRHNPKTMRPGSLDPDLMPAVLSFLLALAAIVQAAVLAARLAALVVAAALAIHGLRESAGLRERGNSEHQGERQQSECAFHNHLLDVEQP